jgi:hypothetical protein
MDHMTVFPEPTCMQRSWRDKNFEQFHSMWDEILLSEGENRPFLTPENTNE